MTALALAVLLALQEPKAPALTGAQAGELGGWVADRIDAGPAADELERAIAEKIEALRKPAPAPAPSDGKKRKGGKKTAPRGSNAQAPETIKNGLTESDRVALGTFVAGEIAAERQGEPLAEAAKKELERLRAERVKASSVSTARKTRKK
ncbi:MAG TPA: hypothetical protein VJB14_05070 [Planctomycetota bacterium]|nr:hypothetical protein [Planctomycetota bacterium]